MAALRLALRPFGAIPWPVRLGVLLVSFAGWVANYLCFHDLLLGWLARAGFAVVFWAFAWHNDAELRWLRAPLALVRGNWGATLLWTLTAFGPLALATAFGIHLGPLLTRLNALLWMASSVLLCLPMRRVTEALSRRRSQRE